MAVPLHKRPSVSNLCGRTSAKHGIFRENLRLSRARSRKPGLRRSLIQNSLDLILVNILVAVVRSNAQLSLRKLIHRETPLLASCCNTVPSRKNTVHSGRIGVRQSGHPGEIRYLNVVAVILYVHTLTCVYVKKHIVSAAMSFLALRAADILGVYESEARTFAQSQLDYILGSSGRSYMIYNSSTSPQFVKHKASYVHVHVHGHVTASLSVAVKVF